MREVKVFIFCLLMSSLVSASPNFFDQFKQQAGDFFRSKLDGLEQKAKAQYGLQRYHQKKWIAVSEFSLPSEVVLLVHGLDDPGFLWNQLAEVLTAKNHCVVRLSYPNDQSISVSTNEMAIQLKKLWHFKVKNLSIIGHSMGGIITRDVLTHNEFYHGKRDGFKQAPIVDRVITIGAPNHGSHFANFHLVSEFGEQFLHLLNGDAYFLGFLYDGYGEAGKDLLPQSQYLKQLNQRELPSNIPFTVIAGKIGYEVTEKIKQSTRGWDISHQLLKDSLKKFNSIVSDSTNVMGDGVVTLASAKLKGVDDFHVVDGNHISMLTNFGLGPAWPSSFEIILKRLKK